MGDNEVKLVREYIKLNDEFMKASENPNQTILARQLLAEIQGIIFAYETYTSLFFQKLLEKYDEYMSK